MFTGYWYVLMQAKIQKYSVIKKGGRHYREKSVIFAALAECKGII